MVTVEVIWFVDGGLKLHEAPSGKPLQLNVTVPTPVLESTWKVTNPVMPAGTATSPLVAVIESGGPVCVSSEAVLLLGFTSPPPETVAVLVKLAWMLIGTFTVSVIAG